MTYPSNFNVVWEETSTDRIVIRDVGPWDRFKTVTNDAERVVDRLMADRLLKPGRRLFYYDSDGEYAEILWQDRRHIAFAPAVQEASP